MAPVKTGDTVTVGYRVRLGNGTVVDEADRGRPLLFTVGAGEVRPEIDRAVSGLEPGDWAQTSLSADEAFGRYERDLVAVLPIDRLPGDVHPRLGQQLQVALDRDATPIIVRVTQLSETTVTLDANHELAGEDLFIDLEVLDVTPPIA